MVISHLFGGLGNQLFQYAAGQCIALKHQVPLTLDLADFAHYKLRKFDLEYFNTVNRVATPQEVSQLKPSSVISKALQYTRPKRQRTYHRERSYFFDPSFNLIGPNVYLKGYFQCLPYFEPIEQTIRNEFTIKPQYTSHLETIASKLRQPGSVAIHIRRGDYEKKEVQDLLAAVDIPYYVKAVELMQAKIPNPEFFFFSDDIGWVKANMDLPGAHYISGVQSHTHIEDFYLLSQAANQIIPNSTFAWWAAWLNPNAAKQVVMPARWFNDNSQNRDRTPSRWMTL